MKKEVFQTMLSLIQPTITAFTIVGPTTLTMLPFVSLHWFELKSLKVMFLFVLPHCYVHK